MVRGKFEEGDETALARSHFPPEESTVNPKPVASEALVVMGGWAGVCVGYDKKGLSTIFLYKYVSEKDAQIPKIFSRSVYHHNKKR